MFKRKNGRRYSRNGRAHARRGIETVEFALILPVLVLLGLGAVEFSRALTVQQILTNAARAGAREGVVPNATSDDAVNRVQGQLQVGRINPTAAVITVTPASLADAKSGDDVNVRVQVPYMAVTWLPVPRFLGNTVLSSECTMRRE